MSIKLFERAIIRRGLNIVHRSELHLRFQVCLEIRLIRMNIDLKYPWNNQYVL